MATNISVGEEFEEKMFVWNTIEGFDDVKEDDGELGVASEGRVGVAKKFIYVVVSRELFAEACLIVGEELCVIEVSREAMVNKTFEEAHGDAGDADNTVGRRVRVVALFKEGEGFGFFPLLRDNVMTP